MERLNTRTRLIPVAGLNQAELSINLNFIKALVRLPIIHRTQEPVREQAIVIL